MPLVTPQELLLNAQKNRYAIGAFNIENMEMAQGVIAAAEELRAPVIIQTTPSTIRYASVDCIMQTYGRLQGIRLCPLPCTWIMVTVLNWP